MFLLKVMQNLSNKNNCFVKLNFIPIHPNDAFLYPLKTSKNQRFLDFFGEWYRNNITISENFKVIDRFY